MPDYNIIKKIIAELNELKPVTVAENLLAKYDKKEKEQIIKLQELYNKEIDFLHTRDGSGVSTPDGIVKASFIDKISGLNDYLPKFPSTSDVTNIASFSTVDGFLDTEITQRLAKMQAKKPGMKALLKKAELTMEAMKTKIDDGLSKADRDLKAARKQLRFKDRFTSNGRKKRKDINDEIKRLKESKKKFRSCYATAVKNFKFAKTKLMTFKENKRTAKTTAYKKYDIITQKTFLNTLTNKRSAAKRSTGTRSTGVWDVLTDAHLFLTKFVDGYQFTFGCKTALKNLIDAFIATEDKSYSKNKEKISVAYNHVFLTLRAMGGAKLPASTVKKLEGIIGGFDTLVKQSSERSKEFMDSYVAEFKTKVKFFSNSDGKMPDVAPQRSFKLLTDDLNSWYNQGVKTCKEFTLDGAGTGTIDKIREKLEYLWYIINLTAAYSYSTYLFDYKDSNVAHSLLNGLLFVALYSLNFSICVTAAVGMAPCALALMGCLFLCIFSVPFVVYSGEYKEFVYERGYDERWVPNQPNTSAKKDE